MSVTIKEVASRAGVSIATVSRVLNDSGPVNDDTRRRVLAAADELSYRPHGTARSLITSKTFTIGVLLPDLYGEFFSEVIRGVDQAARRSRYQVLVSSSHDTVAELEAALRAMSGRIDGLIVMSPDIGARTLDDNLPPGLPVVLLNCYLDGDAFDSLNIDNFGGAYAMVKHLRRHGHDRIAIIRGGRGNYDADERLRGYRAALAEGDGAPPDGLEFEGDFTESGGYLAARQIMERHPRPTAIFASNDSMAIGALRALRESGLRVPDDVAVAGFDDIPIAGYVTPALSSVHVSISEMGAEAVQMLLNVIEEGADRKTEQRVLTTTLVVRESCGGHV